MKIGLALAGGGASGAVHVGVLGALEELNIKVDYISGTSSGSIVAGLFACGYSPGEIAQIFLKSATADLLDYNLVNIAIGAASRFFGTPHPANGLIKGNKLCSLLEQYCKNMGVTDISKTRTPLAIPAVDILTGETVMYVSDKRFFMDEELLVHLEEVKIWDAIRASASFPGVFCPHVVNGRTLVDGGLTDNLPVKPLFSFGADSVIAVDLAKNIAPTHAVESIFDIAGQSINIMRHYIEKEEKAPNVKLIKPDVSHVGLLDFSHLEELFKLGFDTTMAAFGRS